MKLTRDTPPGTLKVQMEQVLRADRELLTIMAQEHSGPFVYEPGGKMPLDILMGNLHAIPESASSHSLVTCRVKKA